MPSGGLPGLHFQDGAFLDQAEALGSVREGEKEGWLFPIELESDVNDVAVRVQPCPHLVHAPVEGLRHPRSPARPR